jgi:N4-gp56 family major capsid protein
MATNTASQFSADIVAYIAEKTLPLARRQLVAYQFGDPLTLPKGRGTTYTATRYLRVPLPFAPLSEGVPPVGEAMTIQQVSATAQQWGDKITITDVAEMTIYHPLFQKATELVGLQVAETLERNTFNTLNAGTQINYVNSRGSRNALAAGDVLNPFEVQRAYSMLFTLGAPRFMGDEMTDTKLDADAGGQKASNNPRTMPHFTAIVHPFAAADLRQNSQVQTAWAYSDINRIYNFEAGEFNGIRFCETNLVPAFTGFANNAAGATYTAGTSGSLATNATYKVVITGSDTQNQYETQIYTVSGSVNVTGPNGSITVVTPSTVGFTYNIYVGTAAAGNTISSLAFLGVTTSGPTSGPLAGQAVQLPPATSVVITGLGLAQAPPAPPASGVTVYPTYIIGRGAYGQVVLDDAKFTYLKEADKSDPLNQLRVVGWKAFYGTLIENQQFFMRVESASAFNATFG